MQNDEADFEAWVDELDDSTRLAWLAFLGGMFWWDALRAELGEEA